MVLTYRNYCTRGITVKSFSSYHGITTFPITILFSDTCTYSGCVCMCVCSNKVNPAQIGDRQNGLDSRPCESCFSEFCRCELSVDIGKQSCSTKLIADLRGSSPHCDFSPYFWQLGRGDWSDWYFVTLLLTSTRSGSRHVTLWSSLLTQCFALCIIVLCHSLDLHMKSNFGPYFGRLGLVTEN